MYTVRIFMKCTHVCYEASNILVDDKKTYILRLCALRVNKCEFSVYTVRIFIKCTHVCYEASNILVDDRKTYIL